MSLRTWWRDLGYCWDSCRENTRAFGIRPFGKRWFWFIIDNTESAVRVDRNPTGEASTDAKGGES